MSVRAETESALRSRWTRGESLVTPGPGVRAPGPGGAADAGAGAAAAGVAACAGWFGSHQYFHPAKPPPAIKAITKNATSPGWPSERRGARAGANGLGVIVGRRGATACWASRER